MHHSAAARPVGERDEQPDVFRLARAGPPPTSLILAPALSDLRLVKVDDLARRLVEERRAVEDDEAVPLVAAAAFGRREVGQMRPKRRQLVNLLRIGERAKRRAYFFS